MSNWEIKVGGEYPVRDSSFGQVRRVVAIDGDIIYFERRYPDDKKSSGHGDLPTTCFRNLSLPEDQSPIPALVSALKFVIEHPYAARGLGGNAHLDWIEMQRLAREALAKTVAVSEPQAQVSA